MKMLTRFFLCIPMCLLSLSVFANQTQVQDLYPFDNKISSARFYSLTHEIRCVVCQNENLAESNAPLANDLRDKIYRMVLQNKTDTEIKTYLVARYGEFVLFKPPINPATFLLWAFPIIGLLIIFLLLYARGERKT